MRLTPPVEPKRVVFAEPTLDAFSYVTPQEKHYLRGALEVSTILIVGNVDYLLNTNARGGTLRAGEQRWDLRYDWPTFRSKLSGDYWRLDTNHFNTNYISHPFAGTMYYTAARANHLNPFESFAYAATGSLAWEMFGELKEVVSVNDVFVTSSAGFAIGEPLMQLSSFFYRSRKSLRNDVLAAFFSPVKALNDWADMAEHARSKSFDSAGLTEDEWQRFQLFAGGGITSQRNQLYADARAGIDLHVINLPGFEKPGHRRYLFDDGNDAALRFETTLSEGQLRDATFATRLVPLGWYEAAVETGGDGRAYGDSVLLGMLASFEYSVHDYNRDRSQPLDLMSVISPLGAVFEYAHRGGSFYARTRLELSGEFAGVTSRALNDYRVARNGDDTNLQTVLKQEGYYHALGATVAPSVDLGWGNVDLGVRSSFDTWKGIRGFDDQQEAITREVPLSDQRVDLRAWAGLRLPGTPVRFEVLGRRRLRMGNVGDVRTTANESSLYTSCGVVF